jgi:hypothetical protein
VRTRATEDSVRAKRRAEVEQLYPELTRFYGLTPAELAATPQNILKIYIKKLPILKAREQLDAIGAATFINLPKDARTRVLRALERAADVERAPIKPTSHEGLTAALGIGVHVVDKDGNPVEEVTPNA